MEIEALRIEAVKLISSKKFGDERGFFSETYNRKAFFQAGIELDFVQDNHAFSATTYTLRGLHFQKPPVAQDKLVRVSRGRIFDVAVDLRKSSATYGEWVAAEISAEKWNQILVPIGFAHGYLTLEPDTEVFYKVTDSYAPEHELGFSWNDPDLAIDWPVDAGKVTLSAKDKQLGAFKTFETPFA